MDTVTRERRSEIMRAIKGKNTRPEVLLRMALVRAGVGGFVLHDGALPGRPDIVFHGQKVAVLVEGCFWHGHKRCYKLPKTNKKFWRAKVEANVARDERNRRKLVRTGWTPVRIWECDLKRDLPGAALWVQAMLDA